MNVSRATIATVARVPDGTGPPTRATNAASRTPTPPGTGTRMNPTTHERIAAGATVVQPSRGSNARAMNHVAEPISSQLGTYRASSHIDADQAGTSIDRSRFRMRSTRAT